MREDNLQFKIANEALAKSPRFVVAILFDVGSIYITSHNDIASVPGIVLEGALQRPSAISQRIVPDEGRSEIGTFDFDIVDVGSSFTDEIRAKLTAGAGLRNRTVQLWHGYRGFDFSAFQLFQTQIVSNCEYNEGIYSVTCQDITRQQRTNIFEVKETTLAATCTESDTTISVASTAAFLPVTHGLGWSDGPGLTVYYFKIDKEIIRATGKTSTTFTGCTRGAFNTAAAPHTVDAASPQERRPKVTEFVYLDLPAPKAALAVLTGIIVDSTGTGTESLLPDHWHMGIDPDFVRFDDFVGIGTDLWDPADDTEGFITRFEGLTRQDGKSFVEKQIYLLLGAYSPVYSDGTLGLRRLPAMVSDAAPVATLTEREITKILPLQHDYSSLHNQIRVTWGYDIGVERFTRDSIFIDAQSVDIHGKSPIIEYAFRGLHSGIHTENMIRVRLNAIRDAYSYPPERTSVDVLSSLNRYETGDVVRLQVRNVRDFAGITDNIDRSFLITRRSIDFVTGQLSFELFGSTLRPDATGPSTEVTAPLPDGFYTSAGVALSSVVGMTGNSVNTGTHTISGNASLLASGAIVYHNGDLVIPNGATINISANVQLRVRGFITMNGVINGVGGGLPGVSDLVTPVHTSPLVDGNPGFIGNSRGWDGIDMRAAAIARGGSESMVTIPAALARGRYEAWPELNLREVGGTLVGLPGDLRGTGGPPGGRTILSYSLHQTAAGGAGANGGAGLAIICRGISFGVSALINLSGADTTNPSATSIPTALPDIYPGAGGAGGPGACLIVLDGNTLLFPNALGRFQARTGTINQAGIPIPERAYQWSFSFANRAANPDFVPWSGYRDEQIVSDLDMSIAALRVVYVPYSQTPAENQNELPAPITDLTVTANAGFNAIRAMLPAANSFDLVEYYAAITNDRTGAVLVARGRMSEFQHSLPVLATRYYWARTTRTNDAGREFYSAWYPVSSTGGVSATTLNPGGWTPVTTASGGATMIATASTIEKSGGSSSWDSQAYSAEAYPACFVSFRANDATHNFMIGLNADPATDADYNSLDYAWYCLADGSLYFYESGTGISAGASYDPTTVLAITYDGERVRYLRNGSVVRSVIAVGLTLALDSSFDSPGGKALDVKFGPQGLAGADGVDGAPGAPGSPGSPGPAGADGLSIAELAIYLRSSSPPSTPTGGSYNFGTQTLTPPSGGWTSGVASGNDPVYTSRGVASIAGTTGTDSTITWSAPVLVLSEGASVDIVFRRSALQPSTPSPSSGTPGSWYSNVNSVPFTQETLWSSVGTRLNAGQNWTWQTPIQVEGLDGLSDAAFFGFEEPWEARFQDRSNSGSLVATYPANGEYGGKVIRAQNMLWIAGLENIPYDPTALYKISTRIRRTAASSAGAGTELVYCGVEGVYADGSTLINEVGSNTYSSQHYNCARGFDMSAVAVNTWRDFVGYFSGHGTGGFGVAPNVDSATPLYTGVAYFRPLVILNYNTGNGTMECDFIRVEKLPVPDDADNSAKNRIVPDTEFLLSTLDTYWWRYDSFGASSPQTINLSGGVVGGYVRFTQTNMFEYHSLISRRREPYQAVTGGIYTIKIRARNPAGTFTGYLQANVVRHAIEGDQPSSAWALSPPRADGLGGLFIDAAVLTSNWQEFSGLAFLPAVASYVGGDLPYVSGFCAVQLGGSGTCDVDFFQVEFGANCNPVPQVRTTSTNFVGSTQYFMTEQVFDHASTPGTFTLPTAESFWVGAKMYFRQANAAALTIAANGGDTLVSAPNVTGSRALSGRYARAYAEIVAPNVWLLTGQLA